MSTSQKRDIRARMADTGENYTEARTRLSMMAKIPNRPAPVVVRDDMDDAQPWGEESLAELAEQNWNGDGEFRNDVDAEATQHDNTRRAGWALSAVVEYRRVCRGDDENAISDMLGDLMHLCDALGVDFHAATDMAEIHHGAEVRGEL